MSNSGNIVKVESGKVTYGGAGNVGGENLLTTKFNQSYNMTEEYADKLDDYINDRLEQVDDLSITSKIEALYDTVIISDVTPIDTSSIADLGTFTLPGFTAVDFPLLPMLASVPDVDMSYDTPVKPDSVNATVDYEEAAFSSDIYQQVMEKVYYDIVNGGSGLDPDVETALYDSKNERNRASNEKAYRVALNAKASLGFEFPEEGVVAVEQEMGKEILRQEYNSANEVLVLQGDLAQKNTQFAITSGLSLDKMKRDFHNSQQDRTLQSKIESANMMLKNYVEGVRAFDIEWTAVGTKLKAMVDKLTVTKDSNKILIDGFVAETDGAIAQTKQISTERSSLVEGRKADVDAYTAKSNIQLGIYGALTEQQKSEIEKSTLELNAVNGEAQALITELTSTNALKEKYSDGLVNVAAQVVASSMVSVGTNITHNSRTSESITEGYSHSDSLREAYSHEVDD